MPYRVCLVSSFPPNRARLSEHAAALVNALARHPSIRQIEVIAAATEGAPNMPYPEKVRVTRAWKYDQPFSILRLPLLLQRIRPDIIHFNVHFQSFGSSRLANAIGLALPFLARIAGIKTVTTIHNLGEKVNLEQCGLRPSLPNRIGILVATKLLLGSTALVVTVKSYVNYLRQRYRCRNVFYIPHGTRVSPKSFTSPASPAILVFGHFGPYKGLQVMLQAYKMLEAEGNSVSLIVAGESHPNFPAYLRTLRNSTTNGVRFLGYVNEKEVENLFSQATMVVLPYLTATGTSGVFHIACGYGKPLVASDLPEIQELLQDGARALLTPPGDPRQLADAIRTLLNNPEEMAAMSKENLKFAEQESWDRIAQLYCHLYEQVLNKSQLAHRNPTYAA